MRKTERINITLPLGMAKRAKEMGLNLSGTLLYAIKTKLSKEDAHKFSFVPRKKRGGKK
jgi:post-segregation antitoxin (ccd killing protein)